MENGDLLDVEGIAVRIATVPEAARIGCEDVTGFQTWMPATRAAARAFQQLETGRTRLLLELGCGLGALGTAMSAATKTSSFLVLTDKELPVLKLAQETAKTNALTKFDVVAYDFVRGPPPWRQHGFETVLAADVLFLDQLAKPLWEALEHLSARYAVVGHQIRRAVYMDKKSGLPCVEPDDSALELFRTCARPRLRGADAVEAEESVALVMAWAKRPLEDEHDEKWTVGRARM
ncbi:Protein-lysine methyltransferase METTL21B [Durusdinium trenchii]|uniref:Protein-lysine methyltransferase METTL21B n=1 Tax=Durusdinium trenchii TaxID=1381693 RepID=A0ABP0LQ99_9DINO